MWAGDGGGESAKFWMSVLTDLRNRGVRDVFFVVCDGLKGLPDSVNAVFPLAIVQTCIIHLIRGTFRYASTQVLGRSSPGTCKPIYQAATAERRRGGVRGAGGEVGQARTRRSSGCGAPPGSEFIPFLDYDVEIRRVLCSHQRDRVPERPLPAGGRAPRALPHRAGRDEDACTWSPGPWTPRAPGRHDGPCGGSPP